MLDRTVMTYTRMQVKYLLAVHSLGINEKERLIAASMLGDPKPWKVQTLSDILGYSRAGIREALRDLQAIGWAHECRIDGWCLTRAGRRGLLWIGAEATKIALGRRRGFSRALRRHLARLPTEGVKRPFNVQAV